MKFNDKIINVMFDVIENIIARKEKKSSKTVVHFVESFAFIFENNH